MSNDKDDEDQDKPLSAGDDFSDDTQGNDVNPPEAELDAGVNPSYEDNDEDTIPTDEASENPLSTESAIDEVDNKKIPEEQNNLGDVVYNPLDEEKEE